MGGFLFVGCFCGFVGEVIECDCFGGNVGFGLLIEFKRWECVGGFVVLGFGLMFRGLNGILM